MPKINVYLPDDLADSVRVTNVPVSAICQRALEQAVKRITAIRRAAAVDLLPAENDPIGRMGAFTARSVNAIQLGIDQAHRGSAPNVGTRDLWNGIVGEGGNLALQILSTMEIDPAKLTFPAGHREPGGTGESLRFSGPASIALEFAVSEAVSLGHNYVGCEHLLLGLAAEPDGAAGKALREAGADVKAVRQAMLAVLAGYQYLQAQTAPAKQMGALMAVVRQELQPLVDRIERLETRLN
jgi:ATP-dependent Clp protease ATP-binding subunit ClpC